MAPYFLLMRQAGLLGPQAGEVPVPAGLSPPGWWRARTALRPWRGEADVVHTHGLKAAWTALGAGYVAEGHFARYFTIGLVAVVVLTVPMVWSRHRYDARAA